jgi:hypothetical protein
MGEGNVNLVCPSPWYFSRCLTCRKILRHGTSGCTSHLKEGVLRIFIALKNPSPWPGLNPRPLRPMASTLTTTPPRRRFKVTVGCACAYNDAQEGHWRLDGETKIVVRWKPDKARNLCFCLCVQSGPCLNWTLRVQRAELLDCKYRGLLIKEIYKIITLTEHGYCVLRSVEPV